ncbi:hypothetical protein RB195_015767 [Necator americanus]|uniref:SCP domain-containing protein n=1 Tax=Necator americanus TaxID=51031 RepID=A0ABR1E629_NECAM
MNPLLLTLFLASLQLYNGAVTSAAGFKCHNSLISDKWRKEIQDLVNGFRRKVAKGQQLGKDDAKLPTAQYMNQLTWDCNIEAEAQAAAENCLSSPKLPTFQDSNYKLGSIILKDTVKANNCDATRKAKELLTKEWEAAVANQADEKVANDAKAFAQLAYEKVDAFACTYQICQSTNYNLLCFFNQNPPAVGSDVYTKDPKSPSFCSNRTACRTCVDGLCETSVKPALFKSTFCGTGTKACKGVFSDNFRRTALEMHNYYRRLLATGWAKSGESYAKPATKMIELQYDKALEADAVKKIKDCKASLSTAVKENFWSTDVSTSNNIGEDAIKKAVAKWWKPSGNKAFGENRKNTKGLMSAANIAYDEATKVGCAIDAGEACLKLGKLYILCKYDNSPAIGDEIYGAGNKACSKCVTTGTHRSCSPLGGLCV